MRRLREVKTLGVIAPDLWLEEPWTLADGEREITAVIADRAFRRKVLSGEVAFGAGSKITAALWDIPGKGYVVTRVLKGPFFEE